MITSIQEINSIIVYSPIVIAIRLIGFLRLIDIPDDECVTMLTEKQNAMMNSMNGFMNALGQQKSLDEILFAVLRPYSNCVENNVKRLMCKHVYLMKNHDTKN